MRAGPDSITRRLVVAASACAAALAVAAVMTWPLVAGFGRLGRTLPGDGPYAIWNVSWVAHVLTSDPRRLFDANIFHPHDGTLAYSEINLVGGIVAIPGWLTTANPYVAHNSAMMLAFATSALGAWLLARRLTGSSEAAAAASVLYAFCPYFFAHTSHIQLLMGGGIPLSLLLLYRVVESPSLPRGAALGAALAGQALACAYYGIFAGLLVGYAAIVLAITRRRWRERQYWLAIAIGAAVSILLVLPFFLPFVDLQQDRGFRRTLEESRDYAANLPSYLASPAHAHGWLLSIIEASLPRFNDVLFPGFLTLGFAAVGAALGLRARVPATPSPTADAQTPSDRETVLLFGSIGVLAFWASFGPAAGLYSLLYYTLPLFSFLRAPSRIGPVVMLSLVVVATIGIRRLLQQVRPGRPRVLATAALVVAGILELNQIPFRWHRAPVLSEAYRFLAQLPPGPVAEFPFYGARPEFHLHTQYMLFSTSHWFPLVNGYSDYFPPDFRQAAPILATFPSQEAFGTLRRRRVRYITIHWDLFGPRRGEIEERLRPFAPNLRPLLEDERMTLYEVVFYP
jgi:hypothetical protein